MAQIQAIQNYAIFFDDVRVDDLVKNWSVNLSCNGSMGTANLEMMHFQQIAYDYQEAGLTASSNDIKSMLGIIDNMTNVKIFVQNVFNNKYQLIFDGNIRAKSTTKSHGSGNSLSLQAVDYMNYTNRTIAPIVIPFNMSTHPSDKFIWEAQGIDTNKVLVLTQRDMLNFKGKSVKEIISLVVTQALAANKIFADRAGVAYWDGIWDRMDLMADIDKNILQKGIADYIIEPEASNVDTMYVLLNNIFQKLIFEFYQDRDGIIRIKPPFWSQPVLKSHVIDSNLIIDFSENINYENYLTRTIITGGLDENFQSGDQLSDYLWTPIGCYLSNGTWVNAQPYGDYKYGWSAPQIQGGGSGTGSTDDIEGGNFEGNSVAEQMWNFYIGKGFSKEAVAGMLGCVQTESNFSTTIVNSIGAAGLCQWYQGRRTQLNQFAASRGKEWTDAETQILFMYKELEEGKVTTWGLAKTTYANFKKSTDVSLATAQFQWAFERAEQGPNSYPGIYGNTIGWYMKKRIAAAKGIYNTYANKTKSMSIMSVPVNPELKSEFDSSLNIVGSYYKKLDGSPIVGFADNSKLGTDKGVGIWFPTVEIGIKAHIQMLSIIRRNYIFSGRECINPYCLKITISSETVLGIGASLNRNKFYCDKLINLINEFNKVDKRFKGLDDIQIGCEDAEKYNDRVNDFFINNLRNFFISRMFGKSYNIDREDINFVFDTYISECKKELIYPDVALSQMIVDTGWLCWGGRQTYKQNNFARIGDINGSEYTSASDWYWSK